jgi:hypothetical protein
MRKLEGVVKEVVDELAYLQRREARMRDTNGQSTLRPSRGDGKVIWRPDLRDSFAPPYLHCIRVDERAGAELCAHHAGRALCARIVAGGSGRFFCLSCP